MNLKLINIPIVSISFVVTLLVSCAAPQEIMKDDPSTGVTASQIDPKIVDVATTSANSANANDSSEKPKSEVFLGSGEFINKSPSSKSNKLTSQGDDVSLMFQDAPIAEVATTILGDLMGMAYVLDERVAGTVSLKTGRPIPRSALVAVMEGILKANNAVLVDNGGIFHIVPVSENLSSVVSPSFSLDSDKGYQIIVVPLKYIAANEMKNILSSIQGAAANIQTDAKRNLLLVSGTQSELKNMLDTVEIFDVNHLKGMSTAIFRLTQADSNTVSSELRTIFNFDAATENEAGVVADSIIRFVPIERINAILVITPQARYLNTVEQWVNRLDQVDNSVDRSLHVYFVQNVRSGYLAGILQELFDADVSTQDSEDTRGSLSPGLSGNSQSSFGSSGSLSNSADSLDSETPSGPSAGGLSSLRRSAFSSGFNESSSSGNGGNSNSPVKIIADEENNALVIKATKGEYAEIEDAIKRLDIVPLQVLVEATIVEVSLTGDLSYGLEWFFRNNNVLDGNDGIATLDTRGGAGLAAIAPGFSYSIIDSAGGIRAVLNTLATDSKVKVVSSPSLMVLDNHSASINIGDQVPVRTSESTNTGTAGNDSIVTSTIQFVETGVTLEVSPRVSKGGNVVMDIFQSIRTADVTDTSSIDSPTINQRQVQTSVAVQSGETIVLGGLIQDDDGRSNSGIPGLRNLPIAGALFGTTTKNSRRTELLVLITPTAVRDSAESKEATEELRDKLKGLKLPELDSDGTIKATEYKGIRW
jgi:general secretion pathway protein D